MTANNEQLVTIIGDAFDTENVPVLVETDSQDSNVSNSADNYHENTTNDQNTSFFDESLPYQCRVCSIINPLREQAKKHYDTTHLTDKAVQCEIESELRQVYQKQGFRDNGYCYERQFGLWQNNTEIDVRISSVGCSDTSMEGGDGSDEQEPISPPEPSSVDSEVPNDTDDTSQFSFQAGPTSVVHSQQLRVPDVPEQREVVSAASPIKQAKLNNAMNGGRKIKHKKTPKRKNLQHSFQKPGIKTGQQVTNEPLVNNSGTTVSHPKRTYKKVNSTNYEPKVKRKRSAKSPTIPKKLLMEIHKKELVPLQKISNWFSNSIPLKNPYYPQVGDDVIIFLAAYKSFLELLLKQVNMDGIKHSEVSDLSSYSNKGGLILGSVLELSFKTESVASGLRYIIIMSVEARTSNGEAKNKFDLVWCNSPSPDYIILSVDYSSKHGSEEWLVGDRFRVLVNQAWWLGEITNYFEGSLFQCFEVTYDMKDTERLSPWDLFKENPARKPKKTNGGTPLYADELPLLWYKPREGEWPPCGRDAECDRISSGLSFLLDKKVGDYIIDLHKSPNKSKSVHNLDIHVVIERLKNRFYRRKQSLESDLTLVKQSFCFIYPSDSTKQQKSKIIMKAITQFVSDYGMKNVTDAFRAKLPPTDLEPSTRKLDNLNDIAGEEAVPNEEASCSNLIPRKKRKRTKESGIEEIVEHTNGEYENQKETADESQMSLWKTQCIELIDNVWGEMFAKPFLQPVSLVDYPDYLHFIKEPVDLGTIRSRLQDGTYTKPEQVQNDVKQLVFNSRHYNGKRGTTIYNYTTSLESYFTEKLQQIINQYLDHYRVEKRFKTRKGL